MRPSLCSALFFLQLNFIDCSFTPNLYAVPQPTIEVFSPSGFQVSIPHEDGVDLFAFHGNINKPMANLEAGQFSKDILKKKGDRWVFEDHHTKIVKGDVIYYWLFVIKDSLGYRLDDGRFVVEDITLPQFNDNKNETSPLDPRCEISKNLMERVDTLRHQLEDLEEINDILTNLVAKDDDTSRTLKLEGILPPYDDASYTAHVIVTEKLGASIQVMKASWDNDDKRSITFEVANLDDKIHLIRKAKEKLVKSKIRLTY